jgi:hypothetical protein
MRLLSDSGMTATVPPEAFDETHPDHDEWVRTTGRCLRAACPKHTNECGEVFYGRVIELHMDFSVPRFCALPRGHTGGHLCRRDDRFPRTEDAA